MPYDSLTIAAASGFVAIGFMAGMLVTERLWWLLSRPLPRPWRPVGRAVLRLWRAAYSDPSELLYQMATPRRAEWEAALRRHSAKPGRISRNR